MKSKNFFRLYLTEIKKEFDCDTFFPKMDVNLKEIEGYVIFIYNRWVIHLIIFYREPGIPEGIQEEKAIQFEYKLYENVDYQK